MREIKFRVFVEGKMRYPYHKETLFANAKFFKVNMSDDLIELDKVNKMQLMDFTGKFDKNEKEIYERDIIKTTIDIGDGEPNIFYQKVVWKPGGFILQSVTDESDTIYFGDFLYHTIEVVGNEFENPELLSGSEV